MTSVKAALVLVMVGMMASGSALARDRGHGPHVRFGVVVGGPLWWGPGYYRPYYAPYYYYPPYYPPVVSVPASPPVYIEQSNAQPAPGQAYWYYCADAKAYYPYVKECPGGWQRVAPQPPPG